MTILIDNKYPSRPGEMPLTIGYYTEVDMPKTGETPDREAMSVEQRSTLYAANANYERTRDLEPISVVIRRNPFTKEPAMRYVYQDKRGRKFYGACLPVSHSMLMLWHENQALRKRIQELEASHENRHAMV